MLFVGMPVDINEEYVMPFTPLRRARLYTGHVYILISQWLEQFMQSTRIFGICRRQQNTGAILTTGREYFAANDEETCRVIRPIFYIGR